MPTFSIKQWITPKIDKLFVQLKENINAHTQHTHTFTVFFWSLLSCVWYNFTVK